MRDCSGSDFRQERDQPLHLRQIVGLRIAILARPAHHLPLEIIARFAKVAEARSLRVDDVQVGQRIDQLLVHLPARRRVEVRESAIRVRPSLRHLHHVEDGADDLRIVAQGQRLRNGEVERMQGREQPIFAIHCMSGGEQLPERLAPHDVVAGRSADAVGRVRLARRKLGQLERALKPFDIRLEPPAERFFVELLLAHRCFLYSSLAMARRCTSSGPSASRSVRIWE